jgi:ABC-2 type transport system ATP-binding protein/lipopolysaccharide transport system ATP-binding protein
MAVELRGVSKRYPIGGRNATSLRELLSARTRRRPTGEVWSLRDVDLDVADGEAVAILGGNGAGKTTLLRILARITEPTAGVSRTKGRVGALLEVGAGFHPELTGRENVFLNGTILGMRQVEIARRFDEIVAFAGVERFIDTPVKRYSSGMYLRLAFAVAAHLEPDILVVDEVLAVGDAEFQRRCLARMSETAREGRTVLFVSHDLDAVARLCRRGVWLDAGRVRLDGPLPAVIAAYLDATTTADVARVLADDPAEPVSLLEARVANIGGVGDVLRRDEPLAIDLRFGVHEPVVGLNLAAYVRTRRGVRVIDEVWRPGLVAVETAAPGLYTARLELPAILAAGSYVLGVWIGNVYDDLVDDEAVLEFRLDGSSDHRSDRLLELPVAWSVERGGGEG